ncbi:IS1 family transposase [Escherichia coli]
MASVSISCPSCSATDGVVEVGCKCQIVCAC